MSHLVDPVFLPVYLEHLVLRLVVPEYYSVFRLFQELLVSHLVDPVLLPVYLEHLVFRLAVPEYYPMFHLVVLVCYLVFR